MQIALMIATLSAIFAFFALRGVSAVAPSNEHFQRTWARTDKPIVDGVVSRSWTWGPEGISNQIAESYEQSPGGVRQVQYFDKSRMEINDPDGDPDSIWYVTNGLLVVELMSGRMQVGDGQFQERFPADVPVAGDPNDPDGVTYAVFAGYQDVAPTPAGTVYTQRLLANGTVVNDPNLAGFNVSADMLDLITNHRIAGPFWDYMNSAGPVYVDGQFVQDSLFPNPFYSTGRPITEFYWVRSQVAGEGRDVGIQCFERRCLTYTPGNSDGFVVEDGNVGLHYFIWRYETQAPTPTPTATMPATATMPPTATPTMTATATATATMTSTATMTAEEVVVEVNASVDCDSNATIDAPADEVGADGVCQAFIGGEVVTILNGNPDSDDEVQQLGLNDATGGTISISFDHPVVIDTIVVTGIPYDSTAADIESALEAGFIASGVGSDTPTVSPVSSDPAAQLNEANMRFEFENGDLAGENVAQLVVDNTPLVGETTAGTFSTIIDGSQAQDELQRLMPNRAEDGSFALAFNHPTEGAITTDPIPHGASVTFVELAITEAFDDEGVEDDAPTLTGGPANVSSIDLLFENGNLAGVDVDQVTVINTNLETLILVSRIDVLDSGSAPVVTWQVDEDGMASGQLDAGSYEFCFTYTEDSGESGTDCSGIEVVSSTNDTFNLTAMLDYD